MRLALILFLHLGLLSVAFADKIYVLEAGGTGVTQAQLDAIRELVKNSVSELHYDLVDDPSKADYAIRPHLLRLGEAFIVRLEKVKDSKTVQSTQLKAMREDELDKVAQRVTRSLILGENAKEEPRVGEITQQEATEGAERRPALHQWYLGFGGVSFGNLNTSGIGVGLEGARVWDLNSVSIRLLLAFSIDESSYIGQGGLGVNVFLTKTDIAPYIGGDVGYGFAKAEGGILSGESTNGFMTGGSVGVQFFRTAAVNLDVALRGAILLSSTSLGDPKMILLKVGINF